MADAHPSPERIMQIISGFQETQTLKGAIELGLFTEIGQGHNTVAALARQLKADARAVETLCDGLTVMQFLTKSGGEYALTPDAAAFLDKRSPAYMGSVTGFLLSPQLTSAWTDVAAVVRRGGPEGLANIAPEAPLWVEFAKGMGPFVAMTAKMMAGILAKGGALNSVLDVAAGHGLFGIEIAKAAPGAKIAALDWPNVLAVARTNAEKAGVADRWSALPGSAFDVPFGTGRDAVLLTNFLHHFDREGCEMILKKSYDALAPGGRVATLEFIPNEDGITPPFAAFFSMVMLVSTPKGRAYRFSELEAMHKAVGFKSCELIEMAPTPQRLVVATKG